MEKKIVKNSIWLLLSQSATKVIGFFYVIFLARNLGVENFGIYTAALAYFSLISSISDFGINRYLIREISAQHTRAGALLTTTLFLRIITLVLFFAVFSYVVYLVDADFLRRNIIILMAFAAIPQSIAFTSDAYLISRLKMSFSALSHLVAGVATVLLGIWFIHLGYGLYGVALAVIVGQFTYAAVITIFAFFQGFNTLTGVSWNNLKDLVKGALPYGLLAAIGLLYFKIDSVMISYLRGNFETGIYGAAYKFLEAIIFIPGIVSINLFPIFSKLQIKSPENLRALYKTNLKVMTTLGILLMLVFYFVLPELILHLLPAFESSINVIKVLSLAIPFMFVHVTAAEVVLSEKKFLKPIILLSIIPLSFNIVTNFIFIHQYGYIAAAWTTVISDIISLVILLLFIHLIVFKNE